MEHYVSLWQWTLPTACLDEIADVFTRNKVLKPRGHTQNLNGMSYLNAKCTKYTKV